MAMQLWKRSNSVGRLVWTGRCIHSTSGSILGLPEDEVRALFEEWAVKYGVSYNTVEDKEKGFEGWKKFKRIEHPDPNDPFSFRPGRIYPGPGPLGWLSIYRSFSRS